MDHRVSSNRRSGAASVILSATAFATAALLASPALFAGPAGPATPAAKAGLRGGNLEAQIAGGKVAVFVLATDEEQIIAEEAWSVLNAGAHV